MRRTVFIATLGLCACTLATTSTSSTAARAASPIPKLQAQVKTLQKQVKQLRTELNNFEDVFAALSICQTEITADAFQGTWAVIDQLAARNGGATFFGPQASITDPVSRSAGQQICSAIHVTRAQTLPPTITPFQSWLNFFSTSGAFRW